MSSRKDAVSMNNKGVCEYCGGITETNKSCIHCGGSNSSDVSTVIKKDEKIWPYPKYVCPYCDYGGYYVANIKAVKGNLQHTCERCHGVWLSETREVCLHREETENLRLKEEKIIYNDALREKIGWFRYTFHLY